MGTQYQSAIEALMRQIPVITREQMIIYLRKVFDLTRSTATGIFETVARQGIVLESPNGLITTKENLRVIQTQHVNIEYGLRLKIADPLFVIPEAQDAMDCFWLILKAMPVSKDFIISTGTIKAVYMDSQKQRIIEIVKIPYDQELMISQLLKRHYAYDELSRNCYERIGILENPKAASAIARVGFTEFYYIDKSEAEHPKLMQVRLRPFKEAWADV